MELYVKMTSNCPEGMPLTFFEELGPTWTGDQIVIPFGEDEERRALPVVGWTDLFRGGPCPVNVVKARHQEQDGDHTGYLVTGGNSGVRVLDDAREPQDFDAHLPRGFGMPIIWIEDEDDLPADVRAVVEVKG